jgi:hypothetical protein
VDKVNTVFNGYVYVSKDEQSGLETRTGAFGDPFDNLMDAVERAFELGAEYTSANIEIRMFVGEHYLV